MHRCVYLLKRIGARPDTVSDHHDGAAEFVTHSCMSRFSLLGRRRNNRTGRAFNADN